MIKTDAPRQRCGAFVMREEYVCCGKIGIEFVRKLTCFYPALMQVIKYAAERKQDMPIEKEKC